MAYTTYEELQNEIISWCARNDPTFASKIPSFVNHTELDIRDRLEMEFQRTSATGTLDADGEIDLPAGTLYIRRLSIDATPPQDLQLISPDQLNNVRDGSERIPFAGYRENDVVRFGPLTTAGEAYSLDAVTVVTPLVDGGLAAGNALLDNVRDLLLFGSLQNAFGWTMNSEEEAKWTARYEKKVSVVRRHHWSKKYSSGGTMKIQSDTYA